MSNSALATYTKISPNRTSPRNHVIDTVTVHCTAGEGTAQQIANLSSFVTYDEYNGASCNYAVGYDGSIALVVEETDRSWCSSSRSNDHRAITIEVSSKSYHPYEVTDEAYNALIELLTDICQRNGIAKLLWQADSSLIGQVDKQNMTVHRWFANKACPGDYLYNKHYDIANKVNAKLNQSGQYMDNLTYTSGNRFLTQAEMEENAKYIWNYLGSRGWTLNAVAGMLGNMETESTINPGIWQNLDEGNTSGGYGLVQWTPATKYIDWCQENSLIYSSMQGALKRIEYELENGLQYYPTDNYPETFAQFKSSTASANYLGMAFLANYERPADPNQPARGSQAEAWYDFLKDFIPGGSGATGDNGVFRPDLNDNGNRRKMPLWLLVSASRKRV